MSSSDVGDLPWNGERSMMSQVQRQQGEDNRQHHLNGLPGSLNSITQQNQQNFTFFPAISPPYIAPRQSLPMTSYEQQGQQQQPVQQTHQPRQSLHMNLPSHQSQSSHQMHRASPALVNLDQIESDGNAEDMDDIFRPRSQLVHANNQKRRERFMKWPHMERLCPALYKAIFFEKSHPHQPRDYLDVATPQTSTTKSIPTAFDPSVCCNCGTNATPMWRRNEKGQRECNACYLYEAKNNNRRPAELWKRSVATRRSKKGLYLKT